MKVYEAFVTLRINALHLSEVLRECGVQDAATIAAMDEIYRGIRGVEKILDEREKANEEN
jgi:hypothetical protein